MHAEQVKIDSITADPNNARLHQTRSIEAIAASLKRFGQRKPIVVDDSGVIVAGNGAFLAAKQLGWSEVWVVRTDLNRAERTAYAIADNRTSDLSDFDPMRLEANIKTVLDEGGEIDAALFSGNEIDLLLSANSEPPDRSRMQLNQLRNKVVRVVVACEQLAVFEAAMRLADPTNRQAALLKLCESFLATRQQDPRQES